MAFDFPDWGRPTTLPGFILVNDTPSVTNSTPKVYSPLYVGDFSYLLIECVFSQAASGYVLIEYFTDRALTQKVEDSEIIFMSNAGDTIIDSIPVIGPYIKVTAATWKTTAQSWTLVIVKTGYYVDPKIFLNRRNILSLVSYPAPNSSQLVPAGLIARGQSMLDIVAVPTNVEIIISRLNKQGNFVVDTSIKMNFTGGKKQLRYDLIPVLHRVEIYNSNSSPTRVDIVWVLI